MKRNFNLYLISGILLGLAIFYFDLSLPYGSAIWLLYLVPVLVVFEESRKPKNLYFLVIFYSFLVLLKLAVEFPDSPQLIINRPLFILLLFFVAYVQIQRKKAQEAVLTNQQLLKKEQELLQAIFDTVPAIISIYDPQIKEIQLNKAVERITGWAKEDYQNTNILELVYPDPEYRKSILKYMQSLQPGFKDLKMVTKSGKIIETSWANVQIPDGRKVGIGIDITERKNMEDKLLKTMAELERSNYDLEQFAYVVSHDLQAPVRQMSGFVRLLKRSCGSKLDKDTAEYLAFISSGADRMSKLIKGLLDLSKIKRGEKQFSYVDTNNVVTSAIENIALIIKENNAIIEIQELPPVLGDSTLLIQLFQNLIQNGIKFHGEKIPVIQIFSKKKNEKTIFSVSDNGIGIEEKYFERIFSIFQRLHDEKSYAGTGIGLSISKRIIEFHNGEIWVESEIGKGSTFNFTLPAVQ